MNNEDPNRPTPPTEPSVNPGAAPQPAPEVTEPTVEPSTNNEPTPPATFTPEAPVSPTVPVEAPDSAVTQPDPGVPTPPPSPVMGDQPQPPVQTSSDYQAPAAQHQTDGLGIASIIMAFTGLQLIGFILGLIGVSHAKKQGRSATLSRVGWILNLVIGLLGTLVLVGLVLANFQSTQAKARDTERITDVNAIYSRLEEYYNINGYYPAEVSPTTLTSLESAAFTDSKGDSYTYTPTPAGCTQCVSYTISAPMESSADKVLYGDKYVKNSLF